MSSLSRLAALAVLVSLAMPCTAQQPAKRDPKVQAVIDQSLAAYKALNGLHVKVSVKADGPPDMLKGAPESLELKFQRPNKIYSLATTRGEKDRPDRKLVVSDGANLWAWMSESNTWNKVKAPSSLKSAPFIGRDLPEYELLFREKDPFADLPNSAGLVLGPPAKVGDVDVDVLKVSATEPGVVFTLNVELKIGQKDHLIHAIEFHGSGKEQTKDVKFELRLTYDTVIANPPFTAADFAFVPPAGSKPALGSDAPKIGAPNQKPAPKNK